MQPKRNFIQSQQNIAAAAVALVFLLASLIILLQEPHPGMLDTGIYDLLLPKYGLERGSYYAAEELYTRPNEQFLVSHLPWSGIFQLTPVSSLVYPASLVSFLCSLAGRPFSTVVLAIVLDLFLTASLFVLVKALCSCHGGYGVFAGVLWSIFVLCGNYLLFFNSLYSAAMFVTSLTAFLATVWRGRALLNNSEDTEETTLRPSNIRPVRIWLPAAAAGFLLTTASELSLLLVIPVAAIVLCLGWRAAKCSSFQQAPAEPAQQTEHFHQRRSFLGAALAVAFLVLCSVRYTKSNNEIFNQTNLYHSFFEGVLVSSADPKQTLADFQMDPEFLQDVGKSAYLSADDYYISPNGEDSDAIFDHISYGRIVRYYLGHPSDLTHLVISSLSQAGHVDTSRCVTLSSGMASAEATCRADYWDLLRRLVLNRPADFFLVSLCCLVLGIVFLLRRRFLGAALIGSALCSWLILSTALFACGTAELAANLFYFQTFLDLQLCALLSLLCTGLHKLYRFVVFSSLSSRNTPETFFPAEPYALPVLARGGRVDTCRRALHGLLRDSHRFALTASVVTFLVMAYVLFVPRIGAYNNGDFGRMMEAMGLVYTPEDYFNSSVQCQKVIEHYDYLEPYDWSIIRPDKVELTQSWISAGMRVLYEMAGVSFSTAILAAIHLLVLTLCLYRILYAIHLRLGQRPAVVTSTLYIVMFCGSYNLGWLNSLFGEGIAFVGLMMMLASSVHAIEQAADGRRRTALFFLALSSIYLSCAKAQYVLLAPLLCLWWVILALVTSPTRKRRLLMLMPAILLITFATGSALGVYRNNDSISSQDTLYSALLNGILLYADDPAKALEELNLDPGLVADKGKHPYLDKNEYYCAPRTEMAEELIYSKVSTVDYLMWYLHHPKAFWKLLNDTAAFSVADMPDYVLYVGENNTLPHRTVNKCNLWPQVRSLVVPHTFSQYLLLFGLVYIACIRILLCPGKTASNHQSATAEAKHMTFFSGAPMQAVHRLYALLLMLLIALGAIEYPLPMVGNGFSDPIKQLYLFREIYDMVLLVIIVWIAFRLIPGIAARFSRHRKSLDQTERSR